MKIFAIAAAAAVLFVLAPLAFSADKPANAPAKDHPRAARMGKLGKELSLTDEQKAKVKEIMKQARAEAKNAADKAEKAKIMKAAFEKIKTDVLTEDQRAKLGEIKDKVKERRGAGHGKGKAPASGTPA